jgi:DNA repair protein RadC
MFDPIQAIDVVERIRSYLLVHLPDLEEQLLYLKTATFRDKPLMFFKTKLLATVLNINDETSAGKRKIRSIFAGLGTHGRKRAPDYFDESLVREQAEEIYSAVSARSRRLLETSLQRLDELAAKDSALTPFKKTLDECGSPDAAAKLVAKQFPVLRGLKAYRFLSAIYYPVLVPEHHAQQFFYRLGYLPEKGISPKRFREFGRLAHELGQAVGENPSALNKIIGLYCGAEKSSVKDLAVCTRSPRCMRCVLTAYCAYYKFAAAEVAAPHVPIKQWAEDDRPREKFEKYGSEKLSNAELLSIILRTGSDKVSAIDLAKLMLKKFSSLEGLDNSSLSEIDQIKGIGRTKAAEIKAALELGKRLMAKPMMQTHQITSSVDVFKIYRARFRNVKQEVFHAVLLNTKNRIIREVVVSRGSLSSSIVHPRECYKEAVKESAASVIFVHNHPSGDPQPSADDRAITARLHEAGELLGIKMLDHIIIGDRTCFSFADKGLL